MKIYPAIKAQMGNWSYYIVRMKMREVAREVQLAHDIYDDLTLSTAVQRALSKSRVQKNIVNFLSRRDDRFFSSIVVAAMEGEPSWYPVQMDTKIVPEIFSQSNTLTDSFGVLSFGDDPKYYALDGQHRVAAIQLLLLDKDYSSKVPPDFENEMLSVIVVLREEHDTSEGEWMRRYRRLFSSLNRYAKPTDADTNIIMDEDDLFAILTRRLITDHEFFQAPGREKESIKVQTSGKNLKSGEPYFTTLQTLYAITRKLLTTRRRNTQGWHGWKSDNNETIPAVDQQLRPDEDRIDEYYQELSNYWDAILAAVPDLKKDPAKMRIHTLEDVEGEAEKEHQDHVLFWPIGQEVFADLVRALLDDEFDKESSQSGDCSKDVGRMTNALQPLSQIQWNLHNPPWRHLILVRNQDATSWRMRSEDRKHAIDASWRILRWIIGLDPLDVDEVNELREKWEQLLYLGHEDGEADKMWIEIASARQKFIESP